MSTDMRKITYYENILEFKEKTKEQLNLSEVNNWELCRTCLIDTSEDDVHIEKMSVMDLMQGSFLNIKEMLYEITNIQITSTEDLPVKVCKECFSKITALYYFSIQVRKAENILRKLGSKFKSYQDEPAPFESESNIAENELPEDSDIIQIEEVCDYSQDVESFENIEDNKMHENKTVSKETENYEEIKEIAELFEEISEIEAQLLKTEEIEEIHTDSKTRFSDEAGDLENDLFHGPETSDINDNEEISSAIITTTITEQSNKTELKKRKKRTENDAPTSGYKHKQPRVTSPLLNDFTCAICHNCYDRQQDLVHHVRETHPNSKAYRCRVCGNLFSHIQSLSRHMNTHKESVVLNECHICSKLFMRLADLKRHLRIHTGERPYVCSICNKRFQQQFELKCHKEKHLNGNMELQPRIFECTQCEHNYTSRAGLYLHKRKHHRQQNDDHELLYDCSFCEESFQYQSDLRRHTRKHFLKKIINCSECDKTFTSPSAFYLHKKKHHKSESNTEKESEKENENEKEENYICKEEDANE